MEFILSKLLWVFFSPGNFALLLLLFGGFLGMSHTEIRRTFGRRLCFLVSFTLFCIAIFPVGDWALRPLENLFPSVMPDHVDGIILLGGDEKTLISEKRGQPTFLDSGRRYITFATLARKYPQAALVYTGGSALIAPDSKMTDAEVVKAALSGIGVPVNSMVFEDKSRNTHENAEMSAALVHPNPDQKWLLVTSAYHMPRAMACFRKEGWNVFPATTGYTTDGDFSARLNFNLTDHLQAITIALHEYYGLIAYRLMGYTDTLWPSP